ncbi:MAG: DNA polymerase III subunit delta [bacterium]|nr:DNA polymerase III subunit delta [bacterium]
MGYRSNKSKSSVPSFQDLVNQDLKTGDFRPVYLLAGDDALRIEGVVEKIRKDAVGDAGSAFNFHKLHGDQIEVGRIIQQATALPMMGKVQLIWVKNADACLGKQESQQAISNYISKPFKETILVLSTSKADKRTKWVKECVANKFFFDFSPPEGEALVQWVVKAASRENLDLGRAEAETLCDLVGSDLLGLKNEISKLALLSEQKGTKLSTAELSRIIMDQAELQGFDITNDLEPGKARHVLKTWFRLAEWGKSAYEISPLMLSRIRKGALLSSCRQQGMPDKQIAALTGSSPWGFRFLDPMIKGLGTQGIRRAMCTSLHCDKKLKSSPLNPDIIIEKTIMELCRKDKSGRR